jgi:choline dehydrogenase-like flavoprotein
MKKAIIVGSGAGGAAAAHELQGAFDVTVLEAGKEFSPFSGDLSRLEKLRKTGLFFDERLITLLFPAMRIRKTQDRMVLVNGAGTGGTTTLCTGNGLRMDGDFKKIGIDLDGEFEELSREVALSTAHQMRWSDTTRHLFKLCSDRGMHPMPTPKMGAYERCTGCGRCILGCENRVRWDSRRYIESAVEKGARLETGCTVEKVAVTNGRADGVLVKHGTGHRFMPADLVMLAAGGFSTPLILHNSGYRCEDRLFIDPVLCVAAEMRGCSQNREVPMPFVIQREGYIVSPYFDYLSFFFNRKWRFPAGDIYSIMIKLADSSTGSVHGKRVRKELTAGDRVRLDEAVEFCNTLFELLGVGRRDIFPGTINAGHPGGMLPLTEREAGSLHHAMLPDNLYVADATLFPRSLGNPPILTIMALAKKVSGSCMARIA